MQAEFIPFDPGTLSRVGLLPFDFYQDPEYVALDASISDGKPFLFSVEIESFRSVIPVIRKFIPNQANGMEYFDAISPYGYPGMLSNTDIDQDIASELFDVISETALHNQIVSVFIRLHPFYNDFILQPKKNIQQVMHGQTVYVQLDEKYENIFSQYSTNHKRDIKSLTGAGFTTRINDFQFYGDFHNAYIETMQTVQASPYYHFSTGYFNALRTILGDRLFFISAHAEDGKLASGAIFISTGNLVQYHLGGTKNHYRTFAGSKLIFDAAIRHFQQLNKNILHLGGGFGSSEDALFRFKAGFSNKRKQFSTIRMITNEKIYAALSAANPNENNQYFPAYRKA